MRGLRRAPALAGFGIAAFLGSFAFAAEPATDVLDEVVVTGERAGPGLWHVHRGPAQLWILGTVAPLPKNMIWRSTEIERVLDGADAVLVAKPVEIGIARALWLLITQRDLLMVRGGRRLADVLPPDLYRQFVAQRAKYTTDAGKWERYRPIIAAAFLQEAALHRVGLSSRLDLGAEVRKLARARGVRIDEINIAGIHDVLGALKELPPAAENTCVAAALATIENGLPRLVERARAWSTGDVERIQSLPESKEADDCRAALGGDAGAADLLARVRGTWLSNLERRLQGGGVTLAVVNMDLLLEHGGLVDELRAAGYEVDAPH